MIYTCDSHITNLMIHSDTFGKTLKKNFVEHGKKILRKLEDKSFDLKQATWEWKEKNRN